MYFAHVAYIYISKSVKRAYMRIVLVISIRRLFWGTFFLRNNPRISGLFDDFYFKTVKIIFFLPQNSVFGTVSQKNRFYLRQLRHLLGHSLWRACVQIQFLNSLCAPFVFSIFFLYHPYDAVHTAYILFNKMYAVWLKNHLYLIFCLNTTVEEYVEVSTVKGS